MTQLVGSRCVICDERIKSALGAMFCAECGNPVHEQCQKDFSPKENSGRCPRCGGQPAEAPAAAKPHAYSSTGLAGIGIVLLLLLLGGVTMLAVYDPNRQGEPAKQDEESSEDSETQAKDDNMSDLPVVEIETTEGTIRARLFTDKAPNTAQNFIDLVNQEYYDGIIFHRVIKDFMLQTGDPTGTGTGGRTAKGLPAKKLQDEFHPDLRHDRPGVLSMANAGPNTGDTQFFITTVPTPWLDDKHAIFGEVIEGMDVVKKIESTPTGAQDRPTNPPKMVKVRMVE